VSALLAVVRSIAEQSLERLPEGAARQRVIEVLQRTDEPPRLAVAGRVSAGKTTLVNALIGRRTLTAGTGECTRVATWLRHGDADEVIVELGADGRRTMPLAPDGTLGGLEAGLGPAVSRIDVTLELDALKRYTIVDTPGMQSLSQGVSGGAGAVLGVDTPVLVPEVDALLYVVTEDLRSDDERVIADFARQAALTSATTVVAVTKVDRLLEDPGGSGAQALDALLTRWRERLATDVLAVTPVVGLLAETALTGAVDEGCAAALRDLAAVPAAERDGWLASPRRFLAAGSVPAAPEARRELLERFGVHGLRQATELIALGVTGAGPLTRRLTELSGIRPLQAVLASAVGARAGVLKADAALRALEALTTGADVPPFEAAVIREALVAHSDRLAGTDEAQEVRELGVLRAIAAGALELPEALSEDVRRLVSGATFRQRLDLHSGAGEQEGIAAAAAMAARWRQFQFAGRRTAEQRRAAHVVGVSLARMMRGLQASGAEAA
jgi:hypothetical protein